MRGRRELAPRRSATRIWCMHRRLWITHCRRIPSSAPTPPTITTTRLDRFAFPLLCDLLLNPVVDVSVHGDHGGGAANRRRDRRLRMHWRHEQLTLQMALAAAFHHSRDVGPVTCNALRSQRTARAEATNNALRSQKTSVAWDTEFFSLYEEELGGTRLDRLAGVRPQVRVLQHTVEQIVDPVPVVPLLHDVEPRMEEQLVEVLRFFLTRCPVGAEQVLDCEAEQVIDVPKIIIEDIPSRHSCREQQMAEQLAEVPTILYFLKQTVDTPVPRRGGVEGRLGFLPGQCSPSSAGRGRSGGLHGILAGQGSLQRTGEQIIDTPEVFKVHTQDKVRRSGLRSRSVTFQFPVVGGMNFLPIFIWQLSQRCCRESRNNGFSAQIQKSAPAATLPSARVHGHSISSELSAQQIPRAGDPRDALEDFSTNEAGMWMRLPTGRRYLLCSDPAVYCDEPG